MFLERRKTISMHRPRLSKRIQKENGARFTYKSNTFCHYYLRLRLRLIVVLFNIIVQSDFSTIPSLLSDVKFDFSILSAFQRKFVRIQLAERSDPSQTREFLLETEVQLISNNVNHSTTSYLRFQLTTIVPAVLP